MSNSEKLTGIHRTPPDLFLSYNHLDREAVLTVRRQLQDRGVSAFLDSENLPLGFPWLVALYKAIQEVRAVAVFVGKAGISNWQVREISLSLDRQIREERVANRFPVIPVLLPEAELETDIGFLQLNSWVDLRNGLDVSGPFDALANAICPRNTQFDSSSYLSRKRTEFRQ